MGYGARPKKTYDGNLILTGGDPFTGSFQIINKVNFPNVVFTPKLDGFLQFDQDLGEFTFLKTGLLQIIATSNYSIGTGSSRLEIVPEMWDGTSWDFLTGRSSQFPSTGVEQNVLMGQLPVIKGHKIRFCGKVAVGNVSSITTVLSNGAVVPASIINLTMWEQ